MRYTLLVLAFLGVACASAPGVPEASPPPSPAYPILRTRSPEYGIQAFLWWDIAYRTPQTIRAVRDMGFGWVKQGFAWRDIEGGKGGFDWYRSDEILRLAEEAGLNLLVRLDRQPLWAQADPNGEWLPNAPPADLRDFGDYCYAVAARYRGRVRAYQVWNEPTLAREWGDQPPDAAGYTALLKACYEAIKRGDPDAIVISAGLAPTGTDSSEAIPDDRFFREMYAAGAGAYFDMLGVHAPGFMNAPEVAPETIEADPEIANRWMTFRHVEDIRRIMIENGDAAKQIAILEMGWTTDPANPAYSWYALKSEEQKGEYLVRAYAYAREHWTPWVGIMSTVYMADPNWTPDNEQYHWAITRPDGTPLPAYFALQAMPKE